MIELVHNYDVLEKCTKDILSVIKLSDDDRNKRLYAIQEIVNSIYLVGALRGDLDVSVELSNDSYFPTSKKEEQNVLRELRRALQIRGVARDVQFIPNARVPVLQYVSNHFGISCDISIDNCPGSNKSKMLYWINNLDDPFGDMVLLVKEWAKAQNINDPKNGTLNSYSLCLLVLFHFQTCKPAILPPMKEIYDVNIAEDIAGLCGKYSKISTPEHRAKKSELSHLHATFFQTFCRIDAHSSDVISAYTGRLKRIQDNIYWMAKSYCLFVEDPFERPDNAARTVGMQELNRIASAFSNANYIFFPDGSANRNELLSLLCTPGVGSKLGGRATADSYTNSAMNLQHDRHVGFLELVAANPYDNQYRQRAKGFRGNRAIHSPQGYNSGRQAAGPYQSQQQREEYTSDRQANRHDVTTRYQPVHGGFRNGSTSNSCSQASSSSNGSQPTASTDENR